MNPVHTATCTGCGNTTAFAMEKDNSPGAVRQARQYVRKGATRRNAVVDASAVTLAYCTCEVAS